MSLYYLSPSLERSFKEAYEKNKPDIDEKMIPYLDEINSLEGIATIMSCQGHLDKNRTYPSSYGNIQFSVNEELFDCTMRICLHLFPQVTIQNTGGEHKDYSYENKILNGRILSKVVCEFHFSDMEETMTAFISALKKPDHNEILPLIYEYCVLVYDFTLDGTFILPQTINYVPTHSSGTTARPRVSTDRKVK